MPAQLRPMKLGELLDQGFSIYRKNFWLFAGIAMVPAVIIFALHVIDMLWVHLNQIGHSAGGSAMGAAMLVGLIFFHINAFIVLLFYPAFVKAASSILFEEKSTVFGSLRFAALRWHGYLWIDVLKNSAQLLIPEGLCIGFIALCGYFIDRFNLNDENVLIAFIVITPALGTLYLIIRVGASLAFAIPAAALEQVRGFKALRRSWRLSKGGRLRVAISWTLIAILTGTLWYVMEGVVYAIERILSRTMHVHFITQHFYEISIYSLAAIYRAGFLPIYPIVLLLIYYDQRVRKEGYDIEQMIEAAGLVAPVEAAAAEPAAVPVAVATPAADGPESQAAGESLA
ncbi:MAG TPA: hypothetical protein VME23_14780 [Terracidiphilus sp.]|nr:hypothetical protein [Terracidiphilus sp.]